MVNHKSSPFAQTIVAFYGFYTMIFFTESLRGV